MKLLLLTGVMLTTSCTTSNLNKESTWFDNIFKKKNISQPIKHKARITYYSVGQDKWGDKVACPKTPRAKEGITIAAHPDFKFGTKIRIPRLKGIIGDGDFVVQDRGSAVTKKRASKGNAYVFDVFVKSKSLLWKHAYNRPMYMDVYILEEIQ